MSSNIEKLKEYAYRRDFNKTPEPAAKGEAAGADPIFVIQQHDASSMHFDFRLEIDGVLVSWAVPKGPSTDTRERRLAVRVEDHPMEYAAFEGVIPEGEYGAGAVIVWDRGRMKNRSEKDGRSMSLSQALEQGHLSVWLEGTKIRGGYSLLHTRMRGEDKNWLLVKEDDDGADARRNPVSTEPESVLSGKTVREMAETADED